MQKSVLRNFTKFTGKCLCHSLFFNNVAGLRPTTLLKKRLWHMCFPVNFAKFSRTPFYRIISVKKSVISEATGHFERFFKFQRNPSRRDQFYTKFE